MEQGAVSQSATSSSNSSSRPSTSGIQSTQQQEVVQNTTRRMASRRYFSGSSMSSGQATASRNAGLFSGVPASSNNRDNLGVVCPICFNIYNEALITKCGHTFCGECITASLKHSSKCPKCHTGLSVEGLFPNFAMNELASKISKEQKDSSWIDRGGEQVMQIWKVLNDSSSELCLPDVHLMLTVLMERKDQLQTESNLSECVLLKEFLQHLKREKSDQLAHLQKELNVIVEDLNCVEEKINSLQEARARKKRQSTRFGEVEEEEEEERLGSSLVPTLPSDTLSVEQEQHLKENLDYLQPSLHKKRQRMHTYFNDLSKSYFTTRMSAITLSHKDPAISTASPGGSDAVKVADMSSESDKSLEMFSTNLNKFTRFSSVRPLATLRYTTDLFNNSSIVSSIEFDKDNDFFAIAGVTKRIKIYDYNTVLKDLVDIHYPTGEMVCNAKISCVAWNYFYKNCLVSSDYEGTVSLWDTATTQKVKTFQEHEKRCWSVDFNMVDTKLIASGSDDARVKLWSTNTSHSVASLESRANVCCVKFNPESCYHLAFGSADHCVHYYDLRAPKSPLSVFKGHKKAVSYVKFLNSKELVSASTDSELRLWNLCSKSCHRSFEGHINEKNFVGLATDGDYITCGSENNSLYVYYKGLSKPLFSFKFDVVRSIFDSSGALNSGGGLGGSVNSRGDDESNEFVSAVCWRVGTNCLLGANSQGTIKVLEMV